VLIIGRAERFGSGKQVASYLGLVPLVLETSRYRHSDIFYTLGMAMVQAVIVVAFDISLIRRFVRLRNASRVDL
jgi:transposase